MVCHIPEDWNPSRELDNSVNNNFTLSNLFPPNAPEVWPLCHETVYTVVSQYMSYGQQSAHPLQRLISGCCTGNSSCLF
jgi:hypothetical protein